MAAPKLAERRPYYQQKWSTMAFRQGIDRMADKVALRLLSHLDEYKKIAAECNVPTAFIMITHERESGGNWDTYLGNGDPLFDKKGKPIKSVHVPADRGPFKDFRAGALDAIKYQGYDKIGLERWDEALLFYLTEAFNGWGYYFKGLASPYLWGGTNHQVLGKYTSDNHFDPNAWDPQLGAAAVYAKLIQHAPELDIGGYADTPVAFRPKGADGALIVVTPIEDPVKAPEPKVKPTVDLPPGPTPEAAKPTDLPTPVKQIGAGVGGIGAVLLGWLAANDPNLNILYVGGGVALAAVVGFTAYNWFRRR